MPSTTMNPEDIIEQHVNQSSVSDLEHGTEIEIPVPYSNIDQEEEPYSSGGEFDDELSNSFKEEFDKLKIDDSEEIDLRSLSIDELKKRMTPVTEDGLILKLTTYGGAGVRLPEKSLVLINYDAYVEGETKPFDSTYLRNQPHKFLLKGNNIIFGLDLAIATMRKGEHAKIWVECSYAYGPQGCPPRIPPNANILYNVEVLNFFDCKDAIEFEEMLPEDQKSAPFEKVYAACKIEHNLGNNFVHQGKYPAAGKRYARAAKLLEQVSAANEDDDNKREKLLLKLYLNLSLVNFHTKKANRAIYNGKKAEHLDNNSPKVFFRLGQAYYLNNEFENAKRYLLKAKHLKPYDKDITDALANLDSKAKKYVAYEKSFCQNMFQSSNNSNNAASTQVSDDFTKTIESIITSFMQSEDRERSFPSTFTSSEIDIIKMVAKSHNLYFFEKFYDGQKQLKIKKDKEG